MEDPRTKAKDTVKQLALDLDEQELKLKNLEGADSVQRLLLENKITEARGLIPVRENDLDYCFDHMIYWVSNNPIKAFLFPSLLERIKLSKPHKN